MRKYLNETGLPLAIAVFLATDNYDHEDHTISATQLIKPLRQIILSGRVPAEESMVDINSLVNSRLGTAVHDGIEFSWTQHYKKAMKALGYPQRLIDRVVVNPESGETLEDQVPVHLEQRHYREVDGYTLSGKFDFCAEGRVEDFKTTSVFAYMNNTKGKDFILQGSIYRWLAPQLITADTMMIHYIFMDWQAIRGKTEPNYPSNRIMPVEYPLMSLEETEAWIRNKLSLVNQYWSAPESEIPYCNDEELWRKDPHWKYYKNPNKTSRSTKNFDNKQDAYLRLSQDGNVGIVVEKPGEVVACKYCPAFSVCSQKDQLIADGSLQL